MHLPNSILVLQNFITSSLLSLPMTTDLVWKAPDQEQLRVLGMQHAVYVSHR